MPQITLRLNMGLWVKYWLLSFVVHHSKCIELLLSIYRYTTQGYWDWYLEEKMVSVPF